jgi:purine-binding chemotaxis protein CheW
MTNETSKQRHAVDWGEIRRRLAGTGEVLDRGGAVDPAERKRILHERARALAGQPRAEEPGPQIETVEFLLAGERYAVEVRFVREVAFLRDFTPLPCTPPSVLCVLHVRGEVVSIVDLRAFFEHPPGGISDLNRVVVLFSPDLEIGILADAIAGVRILSAEALQSPPATFTGLRREYLMGVTADGTAVLDAGRILSDRGLIVNEFV